MADSAMEVFSDKVGFYGVYRLVMFWGYCLISDWCYVWLPLIVSLLELLLLLFPLLLLLRVGLS